MPIGRPVAHEGPIAVPLSANPALPDTLPGEKQHGADRWLYLPTLTNRTSSTSAALTRQSCWIYRRTTGDFKTAAPSWEGT